MFFPKMFSVILGISYQTDVCSSVYFFNKFGFGSRFDVIKMGQEIMKIHCPSYATTVYGSNIHFKKGK